MKVVRRKKRVCADEVKKCLRLVCALAMEPFGTLRATSADRDGVMRRAFSPLTALQPHASFLPSHWSEDINQTT